MSAAWLRGSGARSPGQGFVVAGGIVLPILALMQVHDTYFRVAHFHYVLVGGVLFPILGSIYYWLPGNTTYLLDERLGKWSFWFTFVGFNVAFFPMHLLGLLGMPRRYYTYQAGLGWDDLNLVATVGTYILGIGVLLTVVNAGWNVVLGKGKKAPRNPWGAGTLDWATELPPRNEGYRHIPIVRSRYPLWEQENLTDGDERTVRLVNALAQAPTSWRATCVTSVVTAEIQGITYLSRPSIWPVIAGAFLLFAFIGDLIDSYPLLIGSLIGVVASTIVWLWPDRIERELPETDERGMIHGLPCYLHGPASPVWWVMALSLVVAAVALSLFVFSYFYPRAGAAQWPPPGIEPRSLLLPTISTAVLLTSVAPALLAERGIRRGRQGRLVLGLSGVFGAGLLFLGLQVAEYSTLAFSHVTNAYGSAFFLLSWYVTLLAFIALVIGAVVQVQAWLGYFTQYRFVAIQNLTMLWYFTIVAWLIVYGVIYLSPHLL